MCCTCYPLEEEEEEDVPYADELVGHPYLSATADRQGASIQLQRSEEHETL